MLSQFQDALNVYLFPFLIAVPIALVLILLATRRDDPPAESRADPGHQPAGAAIAHPSTEAVGGSTETEALQSAFAAAPLHGHARAPTRNNTPLREPEPAPAVASTRDMPLLVVDDSAVARAKLRKLFEAAGYQVHLARDGVEALDLLGRQRFGLMITDLEMPNMDGIELIAAASGSLETEGMPILAITGHDDLQAKVHECQGLYGIFKKPWNDRELLRRVETLMRVQQAEPAMH